jgi:hypothetical protein
MPNDRMGGLEDDTRISDIAALAKEAERRFQKTLRLKLQEATSRQPDNIRQLELGWFGRAIGDSEHATHNISLLVIAILFTAFVVTSAMFVLIAILSPAMAEKFGGTILAIMSGALGYIVSQVQNLTRKP